MPLFSSNTQFEQPVRKSFIGGELSSQWTLLNRSTEVHYHGSEVHHHHYHVERTPPAAMVLATLAVGTTTYVVSNWDEIKSVAGGARDAVRSLGRRARRGVRRLRGKAPDRSIEVPYTPSRELPERAEEA